jgi:hypothetical protein
MFVDSIAPVMASYLMNSEMHEAPLIVLSIFPFHRLSLFNNLRPD